MSTWFAASPPVIYETQGTSNREKFVFEPYYGYMA